MIDHGYALTLAATAIEFPLEASEREIVESHLRDCPACRAELAGFRADAAALAALPPIAPPSWVRHAIGKPRQRNPFVLLAAAALLITASAGLAFVVGSVLNDHRTAVVTPPVSSLRPSLSASPEALTGSSARWTLLGSAPDGELVSFDRGYVALGSRGDTEEPVAAFSRNGRAWEVASLANSVPNCPGAGPSGGGNVPDADAVAIASNGHQLVVVGAEQPHDAASCADGAIRPIAWLSNDGQNWLRSAPFYTGGAGGRATAVWAVPNGWQAIADDPASGTLSVWESSDGLRWQPVGPLATDPAELADVSAVAAAPNGTVLLSRNAGVGSVRLFASLDHHTWAPILAAGGCETGTTQIVAPASPGLGAWILLSDTRICTSVNLTDWSTTELPMAVWRIIETRYGAIAVGDTCSGVGTTCPDPGPKAYLTIDGATWSPIAHPKVYFGRSLVDGPAGVLLIGSGPDGGGSLVSGTWLLEP